MDPGFKAAMGRSGAAAAVYLALVLMGILLEVRAFGPLVGSLVFYSLTALFSVTTMWIHWRTLSGKLLAVASALIFVSFAFFLAVVVGVNVKFWLGGAL
jgi:hypothetical protein